MSDCRVGVRRCFCVWGSLLKRRVLKHLWAFGVSHRDAGFRRDVTPFGLLVLSLVLLFGFYLRVLGVSVLPSEQFTEADAYLYYAQAREISESGGLPDRDLRRWLPEGRDLRQSLNLYAYAVAYTQKAVSFLLPWVSLYAVAVYLPVVCFLLGVLTLCLFLAVWQGEGTSLCVGLLLVSLPGSIERSAGGFGDRDAWCLLIGVSAVTTYLMSVLTPCVRRRVFWTLLSGFFVFLGGLSWEGFGVFVCVILLIEVWRFLSSETEEGFGAYLLWVCCFVPPLYLMSAAYRHGEVFATHLCAFLLLPAVFLLLLRGIRYLLQTGFAVRHVPFADRLRGHRRAVSLGLTLTGLSLGVCYVFSHAEGFGATTVALSESRLMQSVGELETPHLGYWHYRWGGLVVLGSLGFVGLSAVGLWHSKWRLLLLGVAMFPVSTFLQVPLNSVWGLEVSRVVFFVSLGSCLLAFLRLSWQPSPPSLATVAPYLAFAGWFVFWVALARDAKRYDFFMAPALAFWGVAFIETLVGRFSASLHASVYVSDRFRERIPQRYLHRGGVCVFLLIVCVCWPGGGHLLRSVEAGKEMRSATPGATELAASFFWMRDHLKTETAVVAASWDHGNYLNALARVSTITDADHYRRQRIYEFCRFVFCGQSDAEALQWLRRHEATHLLLTADEIRTFAGTYSRLASVSDDRHFEVLELSETDRHELSLAAAKNAPFASIDISEMPSAGVVCFSDGRRETIDTRVFQSGQSATFSGTSDAGGILVWLDEHGGFQSGEYFPAVGWNAFAVKRVFREVASAGFAPIAMPFAGIRLFEIRYDTAASDTASGGK